MKEFYRVTIKVILMIIIIALVQVITKGITQLITDDVFIHGVMVGVVGMYITNKLCAE
jgi:hypothetical protein